MNWGPHCYGPNPMSPTQDLPTETEIVPDVKLDIWHIGVHYWCLRPPIWHFLVIDLVRSGPILSGPRAQSFSLHTGSARTGPIQVSTRARNISLWFDCLGHELQFGVIMMWRIWTNGLPSDYSTTRCVL